MRSPRFISETGANSSKTISTTGVFAFTCSFRTGGVCTKTSFEIPELEMKSARNTSGAGVRTIRNEPTAAVRA